MSHLKLQVNGRAAVNKEIDQSKSVQNGFLFSSRVLCIFLLLILCELNKPYNNNKRPSVLAGLLLKIVIQLVHYSIYCYNYFQGKGRGQFNIFQALVFNKVGIIIFFSHNTASYMLQLLNIRT